MPAHKTSYIPIYQGNNARFLNSVVEQAATRSLTERQIEDKCCEWMIQLRLFEYRLMEGAGKQLTNQLLQHEQWIEKINVIRACYNLLLTSVAQDLKTALLRYSTIFEELNDRLAFYYRIINEEKFVQIGKIPVVQVSEHHQAVEYVLRQFNSPLDTIISLDCHSDLNDVKDDLPFYQSCLTAETFDYDRVHQLYRRLDDDCGAVIPPMVLPYDQNQGVIWVYPDWFKEPEVTHDAYICNNNGLSHFYLNRRDFDDRDTFPVKRPLEQNQPVKFVAAYVKNLLNHNQMISNHYILNIDLDYFVSYGSDEVRSVFFEDLMSASRTEVDFKRALKSNAYAELKLKELETELLTINNRIEQVLEAVKKLKNLGKVPSMIIICDSTRVDFSSVPSHWHSKFKSLSMEYTPKYLIFWLRQTLLEGLEKVLR